MNKPETQNQFNSAQVTSGLIANPQVYFNKDRETLTHRIGEDFRIEMPINFYKKILGISFEKMQPAATSEVRKPNQSIFGLWARPEVFLSKDKQYLVHRVLGIRITKHVNYYKQILGAEYTPKTKTHSRKEHLEAWPPGVTIRPSTNLLRKFDFIFESYFSRTCKFDFSFH